MLTYIAIVATAGYEKKKRKRNERHRGHLRHFITIINNSLPLPIISDKANISVEYMNYYNF